MSNYSILIVEDEAIVAEDLAGKVRKMGYDVAGTTATGEEAIELARRQLPTLVLMDIHLAGAIDGIEAAHQIHHDRNIPVLFLTAHIDRTMVERAQKAEAFGYILKPFNERDLRIQIEMALYKHATVLRLRESEERLAGINRILQAALTCDTEKELGLACLNVAQELTQSRIGFIGNINEAGLLDLTTINPGWDSKNDIGQMDFCLPSENLKIHGIYGQILQGGKSLFTNDPGNHPESIGLPENHPRLTSFLGVPLMRERSVTGILAVGNRDGGYSKSEQDALEVLAPTIVEAFERKRLENQLQTLNSELERRVEERTRELQETQLQCMHAEKLSAVGKLSASIAHEFNNPLQGIMTVLKGLGKRAILEQEDRELLNAAIGEGDRIKKLIRSLQDFNRPSSYKKVVMDVQSSIDSLLLLYKSDFKKKNISVQFDYAEHLPLIMAVPDQIKQVLLNLLANAADACQQQHGGVISISTCQENEKVAISIKDTGIGIHPEQMDRLFQPFYTTKPEVKGTGLGLSICHGIVKNHQGEIRVESQPGKGTTFTVLLPVQGEAG